MSLLGFDDQDPVPKGGRRTQQSRAPIADRGDDFYETPAVAVEKLLTVERFVGPVWEPACGAGAIVRPLRDAGYDVVATDLVDRGEGTGRVDFLMETLALAPNIVTNPPYKLADEFAERALSLCGGKVAMLMRLVWLSGKRRRGFLEPNLSRVWVFSGRIPRMHRAGYVGPLESSSVDFAWFVFDRNYQGQRASLGWL